VACKNNMRQIGLALHAYQSTSEKLPVAGEYIDAAGVVRHTTHSFFTHVAPYLEQQAAVTGVDMSVPYNHPNNAARFVGGPVPTFICPTNPARESATDSGGYGCADYAPVPYGVDGSGVRVDGALGSAAGRKISAVADGCAYSAALYEDVGRNEKMNASRYPDPVDGLPRRPWRWVEPDTAAGLKQNGKINNCRGSIGSPAAPCDWREHDVWFNNEPASFHGDGCHWLFLDGSVRWVSSETSSAILLAAITFAGGEIYYLE
jgi:prepilin-type processing-associated H-X9-DG protein